MSNIEQGISNVEETDRSKTDDPSKFEIPCSIFDIRNRYSQLPMYK